MALQEHIAEVEIPWPEAEIHLSDMICHPTLAKAVGINRDAVLLEIELADKARPVRCLQLDCPRIVGAPIYNDRHFAIACCENAVIQIRDWHTLETKRTIALRDAWEEEDRKISALALTSDERWLAVASNYENIYLFDIADDDIQRTAQIDGGEWTGSLAFSPDGKLLASACSFQGGAAIKLHRVGENGELTSFYELDRSNFDTLGEDFVDTISDILFSPDGNYLAAFETSRIYFDAKPKGWRGNVMVYEVKTGKQLWCEAVHATHTRDDRSLSKIGCGMGYYNKLAFTPNGGEVICGASNGKVLFFSSNNGLLTRTLSLPTNMNIGNVVLDSRKVVWAVPASAMPLSMQVYFNGDIR